MNDNIRAFIALELDDIIKDRIKNIFHELSPLSSFIKFPKPENIHITLKFFSDLPLSRLDKLYELMTDVSYCITSFSFNISGLGAFPNLKKPRVFWLGILDGASQIQLLQSNLESKIHEAKIWETESRKFSPHITIGRKTKDFKGVEKEINQINSENTIFNNIGIQNVDNMKLIKSVLSAKGPVYTVLRTFEFRKH